MLTHVVNAKNRSHYSTQLHHMFVQRRITFKEQLGWSALQINELGEEKDEYDDDATNYLMVLDHDASILASMRLRPATDKCMIFEHFPHLVENGIESIRHPDLWEGSRYMLAPGVRAERRLLAAAYMNIAAVEFTHGRGANGFLGMCDTHILPGMRKTGWIMKILGLPAAYDEGEAFAFRTEVSDNAISEIRSITGIIEPCWLELPTLPGPSESAQLDEFVDLLHNLIVKWSDQPEELKQRVSAAKAKIEESQKQSLSSFQ